MFRLLLLALTSAAAMGESGFGSNEYCSLKPASSRGLHYNHTKPFVVTAVTDPDNYCYYGGMTFEVIVAVNDIRTEYYTDFILQANPSDMNDIRAVGRFSSHEEFPDVRIESCEWRDENVVMSSVSGMYYAHKVFWTAPNDMDEDISFNATFINSDRGMYWSQTSQYPLEYSYLCIPDIPEPSAATIPQCTSALMIMLLAAMLNV